MTAVGGPGASPVRAALGHDLILYITVDSLRADSVNPSDHRDPASLPNIDRLAGSGVSYPQAFTLGGGTPEAFPTLLAPGVPPLRGTDYGVGRGVTLAELLSRAGYRTIGIHSNPYLSKSYGYDRGFDVFEDDESLTDRKSPLLLTAGRALRFLALGKLATFTADEVVARATGHMRRSGATTPLFVWVHFMDVHFPYFPPVGLHWTDRAVGRVFWPYALLIRKYQHRRSRFPTPPKLPTRARARRMYSAATSYLDHALGPLLGMARRDFRNPLIAFTADHGEEFWEHGTFGHSQLYDEVHRVPLILAGGPSFQGGRVDPRRVTNGDVVPTLVSAAGSSDPVGGLGVDLQRPESEVRRAELLSVGINDREALRVTVILSGQWKLIEDWSIRTGQRVQRSLFDVAGDPRETRDLSGAEPDMVNRLSDRLLLQLERVRSVEAGAARGTQLAPDVEARLKSLGYL